MSEAQSIINKAKSEVGYREGDDNWTKYPPEVPSLEWAQNQPWCDSFVSWCAEKTGLRSKYPVSASCSNSVDWFDNKGRYSEYPAIGAQVFFGPGGGTHTGIVYKYTSSEIFTIEGNTNDDGSAEGNGVYLKRRPRKSDYVYGYGYPDFSEGIVCADPDWKGRKGVTYFGQEASEDDLPEGGSSKPDPGEDSKPTPNPDGGPSAGVDMFDLKNDKETILKSDTWYLVDIRGDGSGDIVKGPNKAYSSQVQMILKDVAPGAQIQGRFYLYKGGEATKSMAIERIGTDGWSFVDFTKLAGYLDSGESLRFEFLVFNEGKKDFKLSSRYASVLQFK